jgi:aryl-alcohol dehydrogenase-like predicted oxidoreductase
MQAEPAPIEQVGLIGGSDRTPLCGATDVGFVRWGEGSPCTRGRRSRRASRTGSSSAQTDYPELSAELDRLAVKYGVMPTAIAVAWITRHPARVQVVLGTTKPQRVTDAAAGSDIPLTRSEWYGLIQAAGHNVP